MELNHAEIVLKSKINSNCYYLFKNLIIIKKINGCYKNIYLPQGNDVICFYDMYYMDDELKIIFATRNNYDLAGVLDEENLVITIKNLTK